MFAEKANKIALALLLFWTFWLAISASSNLVNALTSSAIIHTQTLFNSHNLTLILKDTSKYGLSSTAAKFLLYLDVIAGMTLSILFFLAFIKLLFRKNKASIFIYRAFLCLIIYWLFFILFDETFVDYFHEQVHIVFFLFTGVSYFIVNKQNIPELD